MSAPEGYKYDVAFSFLEQGESMAVELNDLLQERMSTFLYKQKQLDLVGKDGEVELSRAFRKEARIVVILYRDEWGSTPWTRVEQDAIKNRAHDHGYDFCLLIPLNNPATTPVWYPKTRIWFGLKKYGIESLAAVIELRVQEAGGTPRQETLHDRKARLERQIAAADKRKTFLSSRNAGVAADVVIRELFSKIESLASELTNNDIPLTCKKEIRKITVTSGRVRLFAYWEPAYGHFLSETVLYLRFLEQVRGEIKSRPFLELEYRFDVNTSEEYGWCPAHENEKFLTSGQVAEQALKIMIDKAADYRLRISGRE